MNPAHPPSPDNGGAPNDYPGQRSAIPSNGGIGRIAAAMSNTLAGMREGVSKEAAIRQEVALAVVLVPLSFLISESMWVWVALISSMLFVFAVEFLNTAIERLCNHLHPGRHEAIKATKDLASAAVFFSLVLAGLVWAAALLRALGII